MIIKILGSGCKKCTTLATNAKTATESAGHEAEIIKITDLAEIAGHGVMATPALMIDGRLVSSGIVLTAKEIGQLL